MPKSKKVWPLKNIGLSKLLVEKMHPELTADTAKLASIIGVNRSAVSYWRIGRNLPPRKLLPLIANALKCELQEVEEAFDYSRRLQEDGVPPSFA